MAEERNRYQRRKIFLTVMHVLFLVVTAAGISAMYLNSDYGKGISWVYDEVYEDSPSFLPVWSRTLRRYSAMWATGMCLRQMESWIWSGPLWGSATAPGSARS